MNENINQRAFGTLGENEAALYLQKNGFKLITRNYRVSRMGEIDIIARKGEYICFVEVKTRSSLIFGSPVESVNASKQRNIRRLAACYVAQNNIQDEFMRFDIIEIIAKRGKQCITVESINHIENAF